MPVDYLSALNSRGSGLNITQIVDSLVDAETAPKQNKLDEKIEKKNVEISALAEVAVELSKLKTEINSFSNTTKLSPLSGSTALNLSITDPSKAKIFSSDININQLATSQTLEFGGFSSPSSTSGSGTIQIDFGNWITGNSTDADSLFSGATVTANTSLGTPISHNSLGGNISILSEGGNLSSTVFTVVGTDMAGNSITETITGPTLGNSVNGTKVFKTVTSVTPDSTVVGGQATVGHVAATFGKNNSKTSSLVAVNSGATITEIASSLNAKSGVSASVINKGDGTYSLVVRADQGASNAVRFTVSESSAGLSTFDTTSDNANHQTTAGSNASLQVDGVTLERSSNIITDIFDGYTATISATTSSAFRASSSLDKDSAYTNMKNFIDTINSTKEKLNSLTKVGSANEEEGPLSRNIQVKTIKDRINKLITGGIEGYSLDKLYLTQLGVSSNRDGSFSLNETTFRKKLTDDTKVFDAIFNTMYSSDSDFITVEKSTSTETSLSPKAGAYSFTSTNSTTASLNNITMTSVTDANGVNLFLSGSTGDAKGLKITQSQTVSSAFVFVGISLVDQLNDFIESSTKTSGLLSKAQSTASEDLTSFDLEQTKINDQINTLTSRYKEKFSAMENAVTSLKSTGSYLENMLDAWNKDD